MGNHSGTSNIDCNNTNIRKSVWHKTFLHRKTDFSATVICIQLIAPRVLRSIVFIVVIILFVAVLQPLFLYRDIQAKEVLCVTYHGTKFGNQKS